MIDIHSHIIFGVDDGPKTLEESLSLIEVAHHQGVETIVATSHRRKGMFETSETVIFNHYLQLKKAVKEKFPAVTLLYGGELYYTKSLLQKLEARLVPLLENTSYVLVEFSQATSWKTIREAVNDIALIGLTPLIAHAERYDALAYQKDKISELIAKGAYIQVNSNHVLKPALFGDRARVYKKRAKFLLGMDAVHCVASDMHNLEKRPPFMAEAYREIAKTYGLEKAEELFVTNPRLLINDKPL